MEFTESNLKFVFDDSHWELITQFDKETDYLKVCRAVKETKSVDFIGVNNNGTTYLFEIKNFKGHERDQEVRDRLGCNAEELMTEILKKFGIRSLACWPEQEIRHIKLIPGKKFLQILWITHIG